MTGQQDQFEIIQVMARFALAFDLKDWQMLRACLLPEIETDYSDFRGEPPSLVAADQYIAKRREALSHLQTQHLSANHVITIQGDEATCLFSMMIYRFLPDQATENTYDTHAIYTHTLKHTTEGWKISKIKQSVLWNSGNPLIHGIHRKA